MCMYVLENQLNNLRILALCVNCVNIKHSEVSISIFIKKGCSTTKF